MNTPKRTFNDLIWNACLKRAEIYCRDRYYDHAVDEYIPKEAERIMKNVAEKLVGLCEED